MLHPLYGVELCTGVVCTDIYKTGANFYGFGHDYNTHYLVSLKMTIAEYAAIIMSTGSIIVSIWSIIRGIKITPHEVTGMDASAAESSAQAVALYAKEIREMREQMSLYEANHEILKEQFEALKRDYERVVEHNKRLMAQVISMGGLPVKMPGDTESHK